MAMEIMHLHIPRAQVLLPGEMTVIPLRYTLFVPEGFIGLICPILHVTERGAVLLNSPGVVSPTCSDEIRVVFFNVMKEEIILAKDSQVAKLILLPVANAQTLMSSR